MDTNTPGITPIKKPYNILDCLKYQVRPKPLEIPADSYYHMWKLSDKLFDGKFSGSSTPISPHTPVVTRLQGPRFDLQDLNGNFFQVSHFKLTDCESPFTNPVKTIKTPESLRSRYESDFVQIDLLGYGEFGRVFKCVHRIDGLQYAVKKICTYNSKKFSMATALQEAYVLATSSIVEDNAYIVRYHSVWVESDSLYISMELCDCSLSKYIKTHEVNEELVRKILRDICKGLKKIHAHDIVHMDIKAENILHSFSHKFKLGDLGLGRITTNLGDIREGDARYLAKEVLAQATGNPEHIPDLTKADIFSLGTTCYEIMRCKPLPVNGPEWHKIRNGELENFKNFSDEINECVKKMMNPDPQLRPTAKELLETVLLSEKQLQVKKWRSYAGKLEEDILLLKNQLGLKKRKLSM
jgi:wee1-like protein kinase